MVTRSSCGVPASTISRISISRCRATCLVVMTGVSGSGKSSLAFDTIYAEGQRRYVGVAVGLCAPVPRDDAEAGRGAASTGLSPAISIEQKTTSRNPRSTVGTVTEIYDYLRLLFARVGVPYSPATGLPIESQTVSADGRHASWRMHEGTRLYPAGADRPAGARASIKHGAARICMRKRLPAREDRRQVLRDRGRARRSTRS